MQPGVTQAGSQRSDAEVGSRPGTVGLIGRRRSDFHRRRVIDVDGLAALGAVAAGVGGRPGAGGVEAIAAVIGGVGHRADHRDGDVGPAVVGGGRRVKAPGRSKLHGLVGAAAIDDRGDGVNDVDRLAALGAVGAGVSGRPGAGGVEGIAAMPCGVGQRADHRDGKVGPAVVGGSRRVKGPGRSKLHGRVGAVAIDDRGDGINHVDRLTALGAVAAGVSRRPGAGGVKGIAAVIGGVGHRADHRDGKVGPAVVGGGGLVEAPGCSKLHGLVGAAAIDDRGGGVNDVDHLAALGAVAADVSRRPGAGGIKGIAAVIGGVGHRADHGDVKVGPAVVGGGGLVEAPGCSKLHGLVGAAAIDDRGGGVNDVDGLAALGAVAAGVSGRPGAGGVEGIAAVIGGVGHRADHRDGKVGPAVVGGGGLVEAPGCSKLHGLVGAAAVDDRGSGVNDVDHLAALGAVAAGVSGRPGAGGIKGIAAMTGGVGQRAEHRDGDVGTAVVGGGGLVKAPDRAKLDGLIGAAAIDDRGSGIHCVHRLAALGAVATGVGGRPGASGVEGIAAVTGGVGHGADHRDGEVGTAVVGGSGRVKAPGRSKLDCLVGAAAIDDRGGGVNDVDCLAALGAVAAGVSGGPGAGRVKGIAAVIGGVGHRADYRDSEVAAAIVGGGRRVKGPGRSKLYDLVGAAAIDDRGRGAVDVHRLAAGSAVAAAIGCQPGPGGVEGVAAVTGGVGGGAQDRDNHG